MMQALAKFDTASQDGRPDYPVGHLALAVSVYADRAHLRSQMAEDAVAAGFRLGASGPLETLLVDPATGIGEVMLIDAPVIDAAAMAALMRIDSRAAHAGASLVVSTSLAALDDVFGCLDQSGAQILVDPSRAERVIALGRVLA